MLYIYKKKTEIEKNLCFYSRAFLNTGYKFYVLKSTFEGPFWGLDIAKKLEPLFDNGLCLFQKNTRFGVPPISFPLFRDSQYKVHENFYLLTFPNLKSFFSYKKKLNFHEDFFITSLDLFHENFGTFDSIWGLTRFILRDLGKFKILVAECELPPDLIFISSAEISFFEENFPNELVVLPNKSSAPKK